MLDAISARVTIAWNPRGIAGVDDISPTPFEAVSDIVLRTAASAAEVGALKVAYERRCPLFNLLRKSGCDMVENWRVDRS